MEMRRESNLSTITTLSTGSGLLCRSLAHGSFAIIIAKCPSNWTGAPRDGTMHVNFEPLDFIARLAALVPKPRAQLPRYHGVFAPNRRLRRHITRSGQGKQG